MLLEEEFSSKLPSPHRTKTEQTPKTKSNTADNLEQGTQVLFTY